MNFILAHMKGMLIFTKIQAAIAPEATLRLTFGEALHSPPGLLIVRNWGILSTLVGVAPPHGLRLVD